MNRWRLGMSNGIPSIAAWNSPLKFTVGFYRRGDLARAFLIAECVVEAIDTASAKAAALAQLTPEHPEVATCRYWHAAGYQPKRPRPGR
jgi:hypothetical protein